MRRQTSLLAEPDLPGTQALSGFIVAVKNQLDLRRRLYPGAARRTDFNPIEWAADDKALKGLQKFLEAERGAAAREGRR